MTGPGPQARLLPDGKRLHLHHGPIDLIIEAEGEADEVRAAYAQAERRFADILPALVAELPKLRAAVVEPRWQPHGPVARRMVEAVWPYRDVFITPMAAVAGAVADEMLAALISGRTIERAYINNGGDIAFHLTPGKRFRVGVVEDVDHPNVEAMSIVTHDMPVRGIATSGWSGRSFSLGIPDSVTVLARSGAEADAAATIIGNAVDVDHPAVERRPASSIDPDTDLGDRLVTVKVGTLDAKTAAQALKPGLRIAKSIRDAGLIFAAMISLKGQVLTLDKDGLKLSDQRI